MSTPATASSTGSATPKPSSRTQQAEGYERFARDFEALPLDAEPYEGFAETMAYLCRRLARRRRAEAIEYRAPRGKWVT